MSEHNVVIIERDGALAVVTLNRPSVRNAFNAELRQAFAEAVADINADPAIRVAVLKGAGAGFCAGADLAEPFVGSITEQILDAFFSQLSAEKEIPPRLVDALRELARKGPLTDGQQMIRLIHESLEEKDAAD